jgi:glycosyltransferase involved in cell wall biosynthesis
MFSKPGGRATPVMLGPDMSLPGGVASVMKVLQRSGVLSDLNVLYIVTNRGGGRLTKLGRAALALAQYIALLVAQRVLFVHVHLASRGSFWRKSAFISVSFLLGIPVILHLHGAEFKEFYGKEAGRSARWFIRWVFERARVVVLLSETWRRWVHSEFPKAECAVLFNPVELPNEHLISADGGRLVVFLGRLGQRKGVYDLLNAASELARTHPKLDVRIAGDGEVDEVRSRVAELGLSDNVDVLGWVGGKERTALLREGTIFVLPSYNEGLPMSVLEAMAHGVPVVATRVGGIPEAVRDGVEGFLIEPGDVRALRDRLSELLDSPELSASFGAAGRARVRAVFDVAVVGQEMKRLYESIRGQ